MHGSTEPYPEPTRSEDMDTASLTPDCSPSDRDEDTPRLRTLIDILDTIESAGGRDGVVSVRDILREIGIRSFAPLILVPSLILVSPLSGIFGLPTMGAILIFLITVQKLLGKPHIWLPEFLKRRQVKADPLHRAITWLRKPCGWIDRHTHRRLTGLVSPLANTVTLSTIAAICLIIPALELLPMATSFFALALTFFAIGLLARDGLFTLLGYLEVAVTLGLIWWLVGPSL